jgi:hypothetical protein
VWGSTASDRFSILFHLARNQEATVADYLHFHGTIPIWDVEFLRPAQDWELDVVDSFMGFLYSVPMRPGRMDSIFGTSLVMRALRSVPSILLSPNQPHHTFHGGLCGRLKSHLEWLFSFGQLHWAKSSPQTI